MSGPARSAPTSNPLPPPDGPELVDRLRERLTSEPSDEARLSGAPLDLRGLDGVSLGRVWALVRLAVRATGTSALARTTARAVVHHARVHDLHPVLDPVDAVEVFRTIGIGMVPQAVDDLQHLIGAPSGAVRREIARILGPADQWPGRFRSAPYQVILLARVADDDPWAELRRCAEADDPSSTHRLAELDALAQVDLSALVALARSGSTDYFGPSAPGGTADDPARPLSREPAYVQFARESIGSALRRVEDIHEGRLPYRSDAAFTSTDAHVIARATRVAAYRDEPWFGPAIARLLPLVCVAPGTARTAPSQSLAIALGHSVEHVPTPESVAALREAVGVVRHAGVERKLARNVKPAERALAGRPEVALRVPPGARPSRKRRALLTTCLEAGWWQALELDATQWRDRLLADPDGAALARGLVWTLRRGDGAPEPFVPGKRAGTRVGVGGEERPLELDEDCRVRLWHPVGADPVERRAWQSRIVAARLRQPFRQVFREIYRPHADELDRTSSEAFAGHLVSVRALVGLARKEGWAIRGEDGLVRTFGPVRARFLLHHALYPGADFVSESTTLRFEQHDGGSQDGSVIGTIDPIVFSEVCRAVGRGLQADAGDADEQVHGPVTHGGWVARRRRLDHLGEVPLDETARMRREAVEAVLADQVAAGRVVVEPRHVRVGSHAVHLATARVTRDGEPVELDLPDVGSPLTAVPWLPYDELLLQRVVQAVGALLAGSG